MVVMAGPPAHMPMRVDWESARAPEAELVLSAPEVTSRDPWPDWLAVPTGVRRVDRVAQDAGWSTWMTYARGPWQPKNREPRIVHSIALRMFRRSDVGPDGWACAVWHAPIGNSVAWKIETVLVLRGDGGVFAGCNVTELTEYLRAGGAMPAAWFVGIIERAAKAKWRAAAAAKSRPKRVREDVS